MFCPRCGKRIDDDSRFCQYCGQAVESRSPRENPQMYAPKPAPESKYNGLSIAGFVLGIVSVFFIVLQLIDMSIVVFCVIPIVGLILSAVGTVKAKKSGKNKGFGIAGIVTNAVSLVFWMILFGILIAVLIGFAHGGRF